MSTALSKLAESTGVSTQEITEVVKNMILSSKSQHGAVATDAEITVVSGICSKYQLNPMMREAHAFISGGKLQVMIGLDGWLKILNRQPEFDGYEQFDNFNDKGELESVLTKIYVKGRKHPTPHTEYMDEAFQQNSTAWKKFKKRMLSGKSLGQCVRKAFGISEVIDDDEVSRINSNQPRDITPVQPTGPTTEEIELLMAECGDLDALDQACVSIKDELQNNGTWKARSAEAIALKIKHRDRINSYVDVEITLEGEGESSAVLDENGVETGEVSTGYKAKVVEGELMDNEPDIGFGEDDTDEFGEAK